MKIGRVATRVLSLLVASSALCVVASVPAQAETAPAQAGTTAAGGCSPWKFDVFGFQYHECIVPITSAAGVYVRTGLQIMNRSHTPRAARMVQRTIINGLVVGRRTCPARGWQTFQPNVPVTCWEPGPTTYWFAPWEDFEYAYGSGTLTDYSSGQSGSAASPIY